MIEESYVSFETARMLKEALFEADCGFIMDDDGKRLYRPTQSLAARWLREVHKLNIYACFDYIEFDKGNSSYFFAREDVTINDYTSVYFSLQSYDSYEEAIEAGLIETLKTILNCK